MFAKWTDHTSLRNVNRAGNETKVESSKDFLTLNVKETVTRPKTLQSV
jgi:hypothetical protein